MFFDRCGHRKFPLAGIAENVSHALREGLEKGNNMTVMEAKAEAVARVLAKGENAWQKSQAEAANKILLDLMTQGSITPADYGQAVADLGNVSQMYQLFVKYGLLAPKNDMPAFLAKAVERKGEIERELNKRLAEMAAKDEKPKAK